MGVAFKKGDPVRQLVKTIEGQVVDVLIVDSDLQYVVEFVGEDGEKHQRAFKEQEIEKKIEEA